MHDAYRYAGRPVAFLARYVSARGVSHAVIMLAVLAAVGCSVGAQYGVKILVDTLASGFDATQAWLAFALLVLLIAGILTDARVPVHAGE